MKKIVACIFIVIGLYIYVGNVYAEDKQMDDQSREKKSFRNYSGQGLTSIMSFCIEGHVLVIVSGDTSNALSIIQIFEEKNGKVVPRRCN